jgi:Zn-dependent protease with chaperone function
VSARQTLWLLGGLSLLVVGAFAIIAARLGPCVSIGPVCLLHAADSVCRLLMNVGIHASPAAVGLGFVGATLLLPALGVVTIVQRWERTRTFVRALRAARTARLSEALEQAVRDAGLVGQVDLVEVPRPFALVYGFRRPRVCVSTSLVRALDPTELRAVLIHERVHQVRRDPLWLLLGHGLATMLFWLPVARDLYEHVRVVGEVEADAAVARFPSGRAALAGALVKMLDNSTAVNVGGSYAISGLSVTERRIDALLDGTRRPHLVTSPGRWVPSVVVLVVLLCLLLL